MFHIYAIFCKANDKVYIGQTKAGEDRFRQHRWMLGRGSHPSAHLRNAWNAYGLDAFEFFFLDQMDTREEANNAEREFIAWYKGIGLSYNVLRGGEGPAQFSDETREKLRIANLGRPPTAAQLAGLELGRDRSGYIHSAETRVKMSAAKQGWKPSAEMVEAHIQRTKGVPLAEATRKKIAEANKGNQNFLGRHHSEETKQAMSEARKGEGNPMYGKPATEERKRKVSETTKGRPGKPLSEETKQKIREARANQTMKPMSDETKEKIRQKAIERAAAKRSST